MRFQGCFFSESKGGDRREYRGVAAICDNGCAVDVVPLSGTGTRTAVLPVKGQALHMACGIKGRFALQIRAVSRLLSP